MSKITEAEYKAKKEKIRREVILPYESIICKTIAIAAIIFGIMVIVSFYYRYL